MRISDWSADVCSSDLHDADEGFSGQNYFPDGMERQCFYNPVERGFEREVRKRLEYFERLRARRRGEASGGERSEEHTSELQSLMRISYAVFCLKKTPRQAPPTQKTLRTLSMTQYDTTTHRSTH